MIFDMLARAVEKALPDFIPLLDQTKLFIFPGRAHEVLSDEDDIDFAFMRENFFLPFRNIAVEDTASCILLWDEERGQRGLACTRYFLECNSFATSTSEYNDKRGLSDCPGLTKEEIAMMEKRAKEMPRGTIGVTMGKFNSIDVVFRDGRHQFLYDAEVTNAYVIGQNGIALPARLFAPTEEDMNRITNGTVRNAGAAIQEVHYLNSPERFILEEMPEDYERRRAKAKKAGRVVRRCDRPTYTPLYPKQIRKKLRLPPLESGGPKRPHERRAHTRTYPDDPVRWPKAHGKTIVVPSSWIGPSTATIGKKRYRVLLDR